MARLEPTTVSKGRTSDVVPGYRLESLLGRGGMGEVHKATQLSLNRTVAVKILSSELAKDASFVARFEKEAAALATLSHPNIVDIVDKGHSGNTWYLVMEYIDGPSLREQIRSPLMDVSGALRMVYEIARGVDYAHSRGVIHRDLKPENILFDEQAGGIAKVTDFGLASFLEGQGESRFNVTETHVAMGTASYMAPEQRVDARKADHRADIYSLGVILYELVTGELPLGAFDPPSVRKPGVDPRIDAIVAKCLKQDPSERYAKTADLLADLEPLVPVTKTNVRRTSAGGRIGAAIRRGVRNVLRAATVMLILAAVSVLAISYFRSTAEPADPFSGGVVMADLDARDVVTTPGRIDKEGVKRDFKLGAGPDTVPLLSFGRPVRVEKGALISEAEGPKVGRIAPDVVDLEGISVSFFADASTTAVQRGFLPMMRRLIFGTPPESKTVLLLTGSTGRYAAVSMSSRGEPISFEWAMGERRGVMLGPPSPADGKARLELSVSEDGVVRAYAGAGKDRRQIAEPIHLGPDWKKQFGGMARPALGCLEGTCRFEDATYQVTRPAPPPPVVQAPAPAVVPARAPAPKPAVKAPVKKVAPTKKAGTTRKVTKRTRH